MKKANIKDITFICNVIKHRIPEQVELILETTEDGAILCGYDAGPGLLAIMTEDTVSIYYTPDKVTDYQQLHESNWDQVDLVIDTLSNDALFSLNKQ